MTSTLSIHPTVRKLFSQRTVAISSMHGKELIMRPLIRQYLNAKALPVQGVDTDEFGSFCGAVARPSDPVTTLRRKILRGLEVSGLNIGIGNEGTFAPHPMLPFVQADHELVMLIDLEHNLEIFESVISTETNHARQEISSMADLLAFTEKIGFPAHGLVLKRFTGEVLSDVHKGIITWENLYAHCAEFFRKGGRIVAESDMRAFLNPTRMRVIETATENLLKKVSHLCPSCHWPGFNAAEVHAGLPCGSCGEPTRLIRSKVYACNQCGYKEERSYTMDRVADPAHCDHCNP